MPHAHSFLTYMRRHAQLPLTFEAASPQLDHRGGTTCYAKLAGRLIKARSRGKRPGQHKKSATVVVKVMCSGHFEDDEP